MIEAPVYVCTLLCQFVSLHPKMVMTDAGIQGIEHKCRRQGRADAVEWFNKWLRQGRVKTGKRSPK